MSTDPMGALGFCLKIRSSTEGMQGPGAACRSVDSRRNLKVARK